MNALAVASEQIGSAAYSPNAITSYAGTVVRLDEWKRTLLLKTVVSVSDEGQQIRNELPAATTPLARDIFSLPREVQRLRGFTSLTPDWDSYGAEPIAPTAIAAAEKLLLRVVRTFGIRPDIVAPLATGGVHLEWSGEEAEIDVWANPNGTYSYLFTKGDVLSEMHGITIGQIFDRVSKTLIN